MSGLNKNIQKIIPVGLIVFALSGLYMIVNPPKRPSLIGIEKRHGLKFGKVRSYKQKLRADMMLSRKKVEVRNYKAPEVVEKIIFEDDAYREHHAERNQGLEDIREPSEYRPGNTLEGQLSRFMHIREKYEEI